MEQVQPSPAELIDSFRANYVNFARLKKSGDPVTKDADVKSPKERPINEQRLSAPVAELLRRYKQTVPGRDVALIKYMKVVDGAISEVIEDEEPLPAAAELITFSSTATLTTSATSVAETEVIVGRLSDRGPSGAAR